MDMSSLELSSRANFLVYNYIKKHLSNNDLAEQFRKVIQESSNKEVIIFKGLENLMTVLKNYYSRPNAELGVGSKPVHDQAVPAVTEALANGHFTGDASSNSKKKKKQRKSEQEPQQLDIQDSVAEMDTTGAHIEQAIKEEPTGADDQQEQEKKSKKKKKKRHLEAGVVVKEEPQQPPEPEPAPLEFPPDEEAEPEPPKSKKRKKQRKTAEPEPAVADDGADKPEKVAVKEESDKPEPEEAEKEDPDDVTASGKGGKNKRHNQPFRRVREEEVVNKHFRDNSFEAKIGSSTGWGYKANEDLKPTQGRSFRHEKTKKKRGSYKGGAIDTGVSSFKFESESE